jgi:hypothetical protein
MTDAVQVKPTDEQVQQFHAQGFLRIGRMTTDEELEWLREVSDAIMKQKLGYSPVELSQLPLVDKCAIRSLATVYAPEKVVPALGHSLFLRNALRLVSRLLSVDKSDLVSEWRLGCKLAHGGETFWHQDAVYRQDALGRPLPHLAAAVWIPLDQATLENGCLHYIRGSHLGKVRSHYLQNGHVVTADVDSSQAIAAPVSAGEAMVHHCRTLHYAGPNDTDKPRRAVQVICRVTSLNVR